MRKTAILILILNLVIFISAAAAQEKNSFSLAEAQEYALKHNYDVNNAMLDIKAAVKQMWEITATGFPQIEISAQYQKLLDIPTQLIPAEFFGGTPGTFIPVKFGVPHNATYGVSATQLIFNGSYLVGVQASRIYLQLSQKSLKITELDVKESIAQSYYMVLIAEENSKILQDMLQNLKKTHYQINEMFNEGFVEETDVKQLQITVSEVENGLNTLQQQIEVSYKLLKLQMGIDPDQDISLTDKLVNILAEAENSAFVLQKDFTLESNTAYQLLKTREHLASLSLKNEYAGYLPTLAAFGTMQQSAQRSEFNIFDRDEKWFPTTVVGLQMSWPIFSGGTKVFKIQQAKVELKKARNDLKKAKEGLLIEYKNTRTQLSSVFKKYQNAKNNRELAREVYDITLEKYREGLVTSLDLVQSYNQYLNTETNYLQVTSELLNARTKLNKLLETL